MRLIHPFMPFISEEIWNKLKESAADKMNWPSDLMFAPWPEPKQRALDPQITYEFDSLQKAVSGIRDLRAKLNIPPGQKLKAVVRYRKDEARKALQLFEKEIRTLGRLDALEFKAEFQQNQSHVGNAFQHFDVFVQIEGVIDLQKERGRIEKKIEETGKYIQSVRAKLDNPKFVANAPEELVAEERGKLLELESLLKTHQEHLSLFR